jgi:hypothetical protein
MIRTFFPFSLFRLKTSKADRGRENDDGVSLLGSPLETVRKNAPDFGLVCPTSVLGCS